MAYSRACANSWVKVEVRLDGDFQEDANHLHLKREAERVEFCDRSLRQDLVAAIEADQVLDLLCHREMPPARRQIGDARHSREGNNAAVFGPDAELALSLERRSCHRLRYVAGASRRGKQKPRARVRAVDGRHTDGLPGGPSAVVRNQNAMWASAIKRCDQQRIRRDIVVIRGRPRSILEPRGRSPVDTLEGKE